MSCAHHLSSVTFAIDAIEQSYPFPSRQSTTFLEQTSLASAWLGSTVEETNTADWLSRSQIHSTRWTFLFEIWIHGNVCSGTHAITGEHFTTSIVDFALCAAVFIVLIIIVVVESHSRSIHGGITQSIDSSISTHHRTGDQPNIGRECSHLCRVSITSIDIASFCPTSQTYSCLRYEELCFLGTGYDQSDGSLCYRTAGYSVSTVSSTAPVVWFTTLFVSLADQNRSAFLAWYSDVCSSDSSSRTTTATVPSSGRFIVDCHITFSQTYSTDDLYLAWLSVIDPFTSSYSTGGTEIQYCSQSVQRRTNTEQRKNYWILWNASKRCSRLFQWSSNSVTIESNRQTNFIPSETVHVSQE